MRCNWNVAPIRSPARQPFWSVKAMCPTVAVLFLGLDHFKLINDSLGHSVGDALLIAVAERLAECIENEAFLARPGSDGFSLLISSDPSGIDEPFGGIAERASILAGRIRNRLKQDLSVAGHLLKISPSVGIACYPQDGTDCDVLMRRANLAMYSAKSSGCPSRHR